MESSLQETVDKFLCFCIYALTRGTLISAGCLIVLGDYLPAFLSISAVVFFDVYTAKQVQQDEEGRE